MLQIPSHESHIKRERHSTPTGALFAMSVLAALMGSLLLSTPAFATSVPGLLIGTYSGNDSESAVAANLGVAEELVTSLAKIEVPSTSSDGLTIFNLVLKPGEDDEYISGDWIFAGPETVDYFVVKAGTNWALYKYDDTITNNMPNMGTWDTSELGNEAFSHVTAYQVTPEPSSAILIAAGFAALGSSRRMRRLSRVSPASV